MNSLPNYVNKKNYVRSKKLLNEAGIALQRAFYLHIFNSLLNLCDWHGVTEALQHSFELSLKSLWMMVGLDYPLNHNPINDFKKVKKRAFTVFPHLKTEKYFGDWEIWLNKKGRCMAKLHETTIYGDENEGLTASELFDEEKAFVLWKDTQLTFKMVLTPIRIIGYRLSLLTKEEKKDFESFLEFYQPILIEKDTEKMRKLFKDIFSS
jgi:hypothetical protein